jgi:2,4-dienoyl-CoA reductase-like NADH-dependent reductase (Old Yellow Enzyme family)
MTNPYDVLFTPLRIGPVTAPNRFYQVPHQRFCAIGKSQLMV